jgi:hypothetical protein
MPRLTPKPATSTQPFVLRALSSQDWSSSASLTSTNVSLLKSPQPKSGRLLRRVPRTLRPNFPCQNIGAFGFNCPMRRRW